MVAQVERLITSGTFSLDGGTWDVDNNVWIVGDDNEVIVIDAAHDVTAIAAAVGGRKLQAIICTHGHDDHIDAAPQLRARTGAVIRLHPDDQVLWQMRHPDTQSDSELADGDLIQIARVSLRVMHTPGHSPGAVCLYSEELGCVFSGDTLFEGGPGATGRSYSDYPTIVDSIRTKLLTLPPATVVHTGHGMDTTIESELDNVPDEKSE